MGKTILVVEDQEDLRLLIRLSLKSLGELVVASSAAQALELIRREPPGLVVLDVQLGDGPSGLDVCRAVKGSQATRPIKVLLLSACGQQSDVAAGLAAGADRYMIKPFSPQDLAEAAAALLERGQDPASLPR
jgi:two-component system phosphate regulon response regulator PhoB